jgi:hypothetical protein
MAHGGGWSPPAAVGMAAEGAPVPVSLTQRDVEGCQGMWQHGSLPPELSSVGRASAAVDHEGGRSTRCLERLTADAGCER